MSLVSISPGKSSPPPLAVFPGGLPPSEACASRSAGQPVLRRGTADQGRALEALGHAVEYLVDSRLFVLDGAALRSDDEAVQIMMRLSRAIFAECPEVVSLRRKLRIWLVERLAGPESLDGTS